jgi:hypothetical protein
MSNQSNRVLFAFFIILATTLNFSFFIGDLSNIQHHPIQELFVAIFVNIVALTLKLGTRTQLDAIQLATSGVSCLLLLSASTIWFLSTSNQDAGTFLPSIVGLSGGAFLANLLSIVLLVVDAAISKK